MTSFFRRLQDWFGLDTRSLALARMGLGICVLLDMLIRLTDAEAHYTDIGLVPRNVFVSEFSFPWSFSLHMANGSTAFAVIMLVLEALFALFLAVGLYTRLSTVVLAVLTISLHNRNWFVDNGGDDLLRVILIMAIFLPWGEVWSVDQWRKGDGGRAPRVVSSPWTWSIFLQLFCVYYLSYLMKTSPIWRSEFTALHYALHLDIFTTGFGRWFRMQDGLMKFATFSTIMWEWLGPALMLIGAPLKAAWQGKLKFAIVLGFWGLHAGIIATMYIGLFPYYCLFAWAMLLPGEFWDRFLGQWPAIDTKLRQGFAWLAGPPTKVNSPVENSRLFGWASSVLGLACMATVVFWNLSTMKELNIKNPFWMSVARWGHLYQEWNMFAPYPKMDNGWIEIPAELEDGTSLELLTLSRDIHSSKKDIFPDLVVNEHLRKLYLNMMENDKLARLYAGAQCRLWNREPAEGGRRPRLRRFSIMIHHQRVNLDHSEGPDQVREIWKHWCFEGDAPQFRP